ncbi:MAG: GtrA family protein [Kiritimatiellales bacterium]|nr:GtrA family protein [Kiritimatiellota bacterium]MBL7017245.1 GtrA family protein [Kiritimatiellales bacterium]
MKTHIDAFLEEKDNTVIQFLKYGICGGIATGVDMVAFFLLAWLAFPALAQDDILVKLFNLSPEPITEVIRGRNFVIDSILCFLVSNMIAYILNVLFVFKGGKHKRHHEMLLFFAVSTVSLILATLAGWVLISVFGLGTTWSYIAKMVAAVMINYAGRKFFVFHG